MSSLCASLSAMLRELVRFEKYVPIDKMSKQQYNEYLRTGEHSHTAPLSLHLNVAWNYGNTY